MNLNYFVGKVCTVFTRPINRDFQAENPEYYPQQLINYFVGTVESVDDEGIMLVQSANRLKTFIERPIVAIAEEEVVKRPVAPPQPPQPPKQPPSPFIDLNAVESLTKTWGKPGSSSPK